MLLGKIGNSSIVLLSVSPVLLVEAGAMLNLETRFEAE